MGVCFASHHLLPSFASRIRWGCAVPPTTSCRSCLAFDGGVLRQPPPPPIVRVSHSMGCAAPVTTSCRSRLAFDGGVLRQPPPPPIVRISHLMGVCCANVQPSPPPFVLLWANDRCAARFPLVCVSRSLRLCRASHHLHLSSASRI